MKRLILFLVVMVVGVGLMAACGGDTDDGITVTPPVATAVSNAGTTPTAVSPDTAVPPSPEPTASSETPTESAPEPTVPPTAVSSITLAPIVTEGLSRPLYLTHAGDGRLFVVEKRGTVVIVEAGNLLAEPFLDIRDRVDADSSERGLLSVAFHPDYGENGRFFVNYTNRDGATVISSFTVTDDPNRADPASEIILLTIPQPYPNHNGGQLQFGPDGYLYVGMGDGGAGGDPHNHGQNAGTLLGALLRLDVDQQGNGANYGIPADNPYINDDSKRNEIWAIGVRNPWRFSFDRATQDFYMADVGQGEWEEVNFVAAGSGNGVNYGWNIMEGTHCYGRSDCDSTDLILPVYEYGHENGRCSVTGGYVYRGSQFPALNGLYFFGDYCSGDVWSLVTPNGATTLVYQSNMSLASFGEDVNGELYVVDMNGGVYQIQP
jgi:glucose/arabinose dehydrogenase